VGADTSEGSQTRDWPVGAENQSELGMLMDKHRVRALPVYQNDPYVEPLKVMVNALVEVHFFLRHYRIDKKDDSFDSFSAYVEQVLVLRGGEPSQRGAYKRKNLRPVRPIAEPDAVGLGNSG
jgi:hypothetical protein